MEQDYYLAPDAHNEEETTEIAHKSKKYDPHISIFILQGVICAAVIIICIIIKTFFGNFFGEIKTWYDKNMNQDTDASLVLEDTAENYGTGGPLEVGEVDLSKGFVLPVSGVQTSGYGYRSDPFTGEIASHNGIDIAAEKGTEIKAAMDGVIEVSQKSGGDYGNYIIINHGGFKTLYGHCEKLYSDVGEKVSSGDIIATVGSTGRSTGPHLHFEIRIGDTRIDPTPFIKIENK